MNIKNLCEAFQRIALAFLYYNIQFINKIVVYSVDKVKPARGWISDTENPKKREFGIKQQKNYYISTYNRETVNNHLFLHVTSISDLPAVDY